MAFARCRGGPSILQLRGPSVQDVFTQEEINAVLLQHYRELYSSGVVSNEEELLNYIPDASLVSLKSAVADQLVVDGTNQEV